jgi:hypothetical protein
MPANGRWDLIRRLKVNGGVLSFIGPALLTVTRCVVTQMQFA